MVINSHQLIKINNPNPAGSTNAAGCNKKYKIKREAK
jgi:hypothetical protein